MNTQLSAVVWLRNNYQDYTNIASLCEAMQAALGDLSTIVPSEQKPIAWVRLRSDGCYEGPLMDSSRDMCDIRRRSGAWTPLYAAPSPTEQACSSTSYSVDVRNAALEELREKVQFAYDSSPIIRERGCYGTILLEIDVLLKSATTLADAPADKGCSPSSNGNAPVEAKS